MKRHNLIVYYLCKIIVLVYYTIIVLVLRIVLQSAYYNPCYSEYFNINAHLPIKCVADEVIIAVLSELQ